VTAALFDAVARIARHEALARATAAVGVVAEVHPADGAEQDHAVTVEMRDSGLVLPRVPVAVGAMGFAAIPAAGDLVLVVFADGDVNAPVVIGRLYHPGQTPPKHGDGQLVLRLPSGSTDPQLQIEIAGDEPSITITLPGDVEIKIVEGAATIAAGEMKVDVSGAGGGRVEIAAGGTTLTLEKDGDVTLKSAAKLSIEANEIEIKGQSKVAIKGAAVEIN
jgi:uncharacterized protein involved in type VI secretion and phage assembly